MNFDGRARDGVRGQSTGEWEYTADAARASAALNLSRVQERLNAAKAAATPANSAVLAGLQRDADSARQLVDKFPSPAGFVPSTFGFVLREGDATKVLQTNPEPWLTKASTFERAQTKVFLPRGQVVFTDTRAD